MRTRSNSKQARKASDPDLSARQQLLAAARALFAHRGLSGTSIRDIAQAAGLNSSLISYYFESKEGLYRACIEEIAERSVAMAERTLVPARTEAELRVRLELFLDQTFALFLEDLDTGLILIREYDRVLSPAEAVFRQSLLKILGALTRFFRAAQDSGLTDADKDPFTLASLLFGAVISQMRMDHFNQRAFGKSLLNAKEKRKVENHIVDLFVIRPKLKRKRSL